jgi:hypothetical protein
VLGFEIRVLSSILLLEPHLQLFFLFFFFLTQCLHLKPLHQPFFVMGFFKIGSLTLIL